MNICGPNVLLQYQIRAVWKHPHTEILIEIPVEKYNIGQRGGAGKKSSARPSFVFNVFEGTFVIKNVKIVMNSYVTKHLIPVCVL